MPLNLTTDDRRLLFAIGGALGAVLILLIITMQTDAGYGASTSSYGTGSSGAKAAFLLLEGTGHHPSRWANAPKDLLKFPQGTTLILVDPVASEISDIKAMQDFVQNGGRVVGTGAGLSVFVPGERIVQALPHFQWTSYYPATLSAITSGIHQIQMAPKFYFRDTAETMFRSGDEVPVVRIAYGKGEVIWWSASDPLTNSGIREKDNAVLLLNSVGPPSARPVLWDEYFNQDRKTVFNSIWESPLRWAIVQIMLVAAGICFTWSRRFGPIRAAPTHSRLAPLEFVHTLAGLYERSKAANLAVEIAYERFRRALHNRCSVVNDMRPHEIRQILASRITASEAAEVEDVSLAAEEAITDNRLSSERARILITRLHSSARQLKLNL